MSSNDGAGPEGQRKVSKYADDESDVEGHRAKAQKAAEDEADTEGPRKVGRYADHGSGDAGHRAQASR